jgi:hypothetical protein
VTYFYADEVSLADQADSQDVEHCVMASFQRVRQGHTFVFRNDSPGCDYSPRLKAGASRAYPRDCSPNPNILIAAFWSRSITRPQTGQA